MAAPAADERLTRASYALLGVPRGGAGAGAAGAARQAYLRKAAEAHPDRGGDAATFQLLKQAYDVVLADIEACAAGGGRAKAQAAGGAAAGAAVAAATYKQLGAEAYRRGEYAAAARHFADAADAREDAPAPLHANRSAALLRAGNAGGALEAAGEAVRRPRANRRWGGARRHLASPRVASRFQRAAPPRPSSRRPLDTLARHSSL